MSSWNLYKPGQGYWTRVVSAAGGGVLVLAGVLWLWDKFSRLDDAYREYGRAAMAVILIGVTLDTYSMSEAVSRSPELVRSPWLVPIIAGIMIGAFTFIAFDNTGVMDDFTTMPIQVYNWTVRPQEGFRENAAAGIIVLMVVVLSFNLGAAVLRERFRRN